MTPTMLRFNDGITIDTSGPLRTMRLMHYAAWLARRWWRRR